MEATVLVLCPRWKWRTTDFRRTVHEFTQRGTKPPFAAAGPTTGFGASLRHCAIADVLRFSAKPSLNCLNLRHGALLPL